MDLIRILFVYGMFIAIGLAIIAFTPVPFLAVFFWAFTFQVFDDFAVASPKSRDS